MKANYLLTTAACVCFVFAFQQNADGQDYCKKIKKDVTADGYNRSYFSPYSEKSMPAIRVTRAIDSNPEDDGFDNFFIIFRIPGGDVASIFVTGPDNKVVETKEKTMKIEFDDHTLLSTDTVQINHDLTDDKAEVIRTLYFPIDDGNFKEFTTKKIVKYTLGTTERKFAADSATAIMHYVQCIKMEK